MLYKIDRKKIDEPKEVKKGGKTFTFINVGLFIADTWYNASLFATDKALDEIKMKDKLYLDLFEQPYVDKSGANRVAKKFKMQNKLDVFGDKLHELEQRLFVVEEIVKAK